MIDEKKSLLEKVISKWTLLFTWPLWIFIITPILLLISIISKPKHYTVFYEDKESGVQYWESL